MTKIPKQQTTWSALDFLENNEQETNAQKSELERRAELRRKLAAEQAKKQSSITTANDKQDQEIEARKENAIKEVQNRTNYEKEQQRILSQNRPLMSGQLSGTQDFIGYMLPGYSTLMFADDASKHSQLVGNAIKNRQWGAAVGNAIKVPADVAMGAVSLIPFAGAAVKGGNKLVQETQKAISSIKSRYPLAENSSHWKFNSGLSSKEQQALNEEVARAFYEAGQPVKTKRAIIQPNSRPISLAERLGLPRGDRGNLTRAQKEALEDLDQYITSGQYRQYPYMSNDGTILFGDVSKSNQWPIPNHESLPYKGSSLRSIDGRNIDVSGPGRGTETLTNFSNGEGKIILTPEQIELQAKRDAILKAKERPDSPWNRKLSQETEPSVQQIQQANARIPREDMKSFWEAVFDTRRPGTYFSGDQDGRTLGQSLIDIYKNIQKRPYSMEYPTHFDPAVGDVVRIPGSQPIPKRYYSLNTITKSLKENGNWAKVGDNIEGLSPDSYLALLKQGNRDGYSLRFDINNPMIGWNNTAVDNKYIYDLFQRANKGDIPLEEFITEFNSWVKPYNGMPARIIQDINGKPIIGIPHPFVYKKHQGGKLNYLNYINS